MVQCGFIHIGNTILKKQPWNTLLPKNLHMIFLEIKISWDTFYGPDGTCYSYDKLLTL